MMPFMMLEKNFEDHVWKDRFHSEFVIFFVLCLKVGICMYRKKLEMQYRRILKYLKWLFLVGEITLSVFSKYPEENMYTFII